jgi:hypothetical protein
MDGAAANSKEPRNAIDIAAAPVINPDLDGIIPPFLIRIPRCPDKIAENYRGLWVFKLPILLILYILLGHHFNQICHGKTTYSSFSARYGLHSQAYSFW